MAWTALIIKSLEHKFGEKAMKERLSLTPGTPRFTARRLEKSRRQSKSRRPRDLQELSRYSSVSDKAQQT